MFSVTVNYCYFLCVEWFTYFFFYHVNYCNNNLWQSSSIIQVVRYETQETKARKSHRNHFNIISVFCPGSCLKPKKMFAHSIFSCVYSTTYCFSIEFENMNVFSNLSFCLSLKMIKYSLAR